MWEADMLSSGLLGLGVGWGSGSVSAAGDYGGWEVSDL